MLYERVLRRLHWVAVCCGSVWKYSLIPPILGARKLYTAANIKPIISPEMNIPIGNITIAPTPNMNAKGLNEGPVYPGCEDAN